MTEEELYAHPGWRWCTAEGAREHVLLMGLKTTFREKLEWLEEAETLSLRLRANREATTLPPIPPADRPASSSAPTPA